MTGVQTCALPIFEVARGGLMRRGLTIQHADACAITGISPDHLGAYGITDIEDLTQAKFVLSKAVKPGGRLILNADDPMIVRQATTFEGSITWFGLDVTPASVDGWLSGGGEAVYVEDGRMVLSRADGRRPILAIDDFEPAMKGAARFNIANGLAAIGLASALDLPISAMTDGLANFKNTPDQNPGRINMFDVGGVSVMVDFAHNPDGVRMLLEAAGSLPANRRLVLTGQAGDRRDEDIRDLVRVTWDWRPDHIVIKDLPTKLRGRKLREVPDLIEDELRALSVPDTMFEHAGTELDAVRRSMAWARTGDLLVMLLHVERKEALALFRQMTDMGWKPGDPVPDL